MEKLARTILISWITVFVSILLGANVFPAFFLLALAALLVGIVTFIILIIKRIPEAKAERAERAARKAKGSAEKKERKPSPIAELKRQYDEEKVAQVQKLAEVLARNERRRREIAAQEAAASSDESPDADDACLQEFLDSISALQEAVDSVNSQCDTNEYEIRPAHKSGIGGFGIGLAIIGALLGGGTSHLNSRCNGNCAACPPHYGYRYDRWYYGHGHRYGCQRGGNGGVSRRTYRY